ncbi:hypothetical protein M514_10479 [Trichuris suis]|uniref:Peptidase S1 domain-containing protein n=1 Tax=Trichuris suis TaxID=68888 RepID=A0A085MYG8_9BILA|nr:hypothetical protein M514_10479 [Trichuris suis]
MALLRATVVFLTSLLFNTSSAEDIPCGTAVFGKGTRNGNNRILGANVAVPHAYPWHAFIQTPKGTFSGSAVRFSSGNFIDAVLTSAQVVTVNDKLISPSNVTVYLGLHDRAKKAKARAYVYSIERFSLSDGTNVQAMASDAAVLHLKQPVPLSDYIRPICLPDEEQIEPRDSCVITGLNHISIQRPTSNLLHAMQLRILPAKDCLKHYAFYNDSKHYCVGTSLANICPGDVGSPVACQKNGRWVQMAFATNGADCDRKEHVPSLLSRATQRKVFRGKPCEVRIAEESHPAKQENVTKTNDTTQSHSLNKNKQERTDDKDSLQDGTMNVHNKRAPKNTESGKEKRSIVDGARNTQSDKQSDNQEGDSLKEKNETANREIRPEMENKESRSVGIDALSGRDSTVQPNQQKETSSKANLEESKLAATDLFNSTMNERREGENTTANESRREGTDNGTKQTGQTGMTREDVHAENRTDYKANEERINANGRNGPRTDQNKKEKEEDMKNSLPTKTQKTEDAQSEVLEEALDVTRSRDLDNKNNINDKKKINAVENENTPVNAAYFSHAENASSKAQPEVQRKKDDPSNEERYNKEPHRTAQRAASTEERNSQKGTKNARKENGANIESSKNGSLRNDHLKSDQEAKSPDLGKEIPDDEEETRQGNGTAAFHTQTTVNKNEKTECRIPKTDHSSAVGQQGKKKKFEEGQDGNGNAATTLPKGGATTMESTEPKRKEEQSNAPTVQKDNFIGNEDDSSLQGKLDHTACEDDENTSPMEEGKPGGVKENAVQQEAFIRDKENVETNSSRRFEVNQIASSPIGHDVHYESTEGHSSDAERNISKEERPNTTKRSKENAEKEKSASFTIQSARNVSNNPNNALTKGHSAEQANKSEEKEEERPASLEGTQYSPNRTNSTMTSANTKEDNTGESHLEAVRQSDGSGKDEFAKGSDNLVNDSLTETRDPSDLGRSEQKGNSQLEKAGLNGRNANDSLKGKVEEEEEEEEVWKTAEEDEISDNDKKTNSVNERQNAEGGQKRELNESGLDDGMRPNVTESKPLSPKPHNEGTNNVSIEQPYEGASLQSAIPGTAKENNSKELQEGKATHKEEVEHPSNETAPSRMDDLQNSQRNDNLTGEPLTAAPNPNVANMKNESKTKLPHEEDNSMAPLSPSEHTVGNSSTKPEELKDTQATTPQLSFFARAIKTVTDAYLSARKQLRH